MYAMTTTAPDLFETIDLSGFIGALTLFGSSDTMSKGAWGKLAEAVEDCRDADEHLGSVKARIGMAEDDYRRVNSTKALPKAWTSAKAVALRAYAEGTPLMDDNGSVRGKTAVERDNAGKSPKSAFDKANEAAARLCKLFPDLSPTEESAIRTTLAAGGVIPTGSY